MHGTNVRYLLPTFVFRNLTRKKLVGDTDFPAPTSVLQKFKISVRDQLAAQRTHIFIRSKSSRVTMFVPKHELYETNGNCPSPSSSSIFLSMKE